MSVRMNLSFLPKLNWYQEHSGINKEVDNLTFVLNITKLKSEILEIVKINVV